MVESLNNLLRATSRSFYLTLRVLPIAVRSQIGLAYLLARTTDTIADTEIVLPAQRLEALQKLRERILGQSTQPLNFDKLIKEQDPRTMSLLSKASSVAGTSSRGAGFQLRPFNHHGFLGNTC